MQGPTGRSAPLGGPSAEEEVEAQRAGGRGGFVPRLPGAGASVLKDTAVGFFNYVFLSLKPRDLLFRGMLPRGLVWKMQEQAASADLGLRGGPP